MSGFFTRAWRRLASPTPPTEEARRIAEEFFGKIGVEPRFVVLVQHPGRGGSVIRYTALSKNGEYALLETWDVSLHDRNKPGVKMSRDLPLDALDSLIKEIREAGWPVEGKDYNLTDVGAEEIAVVADGQVNFMGISGRPMPADSEPQGRIGMAVLRGLKALRAEGIGTRGRMADPEAEKKAKNDAEDGGKRSE